MAPRKGPTHAGARNSKGKAGEVQLAAPSPLNGVRLPVGVHAGHTGGKKGRSGRKPDAFRRRLEAIRDEKGLDFLEQVLDGEIEYTLRGRCSHCRKLSEAGSEKMADVVRRAPSPDTRLRAADLTMRFTVGLEKTLRLEGIAGTREAFDLIKTRIRAKLPEIVAEDLITDILKELRTL